MTPASGPGPVPGAAVVAAAGGVVWRRAASATEVLAVHRPRYDDWSLPKGKLEPGEDHRAAAVREVAEEAGVVALLGPELPGTTYLDRSGKYKTVRYWAMVDAGPGARPGSEVDRVQWWDLDEARRGLSYERDIAVVEAAVAVVDAGRVRVEGLDHVVLRVADVERSLAFYHHLLGMATERVEQWRHGEVPFPSVRADASTIVDLVPGAPSGEANLDHLCVVVSPVDLDAVATSGIFDVVDGPATRFGARGTGRSLYVHDPDGNVVELRCEAQPGAPSV